MDDIIDWAVKWLLRECLYRCWYFDIIKLLVIMIPLMRKLIVLLCALLTTQVYTADIENSIKKFTKHQDWVSFSIAGFAGNIMAARAGTEDKRAQTSLALTYFTENNCKQPPVEVIYKLNNPASSQDSGTVYGNVQVDNSKPKRIEGTWFKEKGSKFMLISFIDSTFEKEISSGSQVIINFDRYGVARFSLLGSRIAINTAKAECRNYSLE